MDDVRAEGVSKYIGLKFACINVKNWNLSVGTDVLGGPRIHENLVL
jgi:hypothetical protein